MMRRSAIIIAIIVTVVLLGLGCIYYQLDPSQSGVFPRCPFLSLTGFKCPGCGSQRAIHALLHGDVGAAFGHNAMLLIALPWIAVCLYAEAIRTRRPALYARLNAPWLVLLLLVAILAWGVLRNIFAL